MEVEDPLLGPKQPDISSILSQTYLVHTHQSLKIANKNKIKVNIEATRCERAEDYE
jgi:hypothetical protein